MLGAGISSGPAAGSGREIVLQGFNWESHRDKWYAKLESQVDEIAEAGFTAVWLPPPSDSVSAQGYLPRDLYKLDSAYGSEAELRSLVRALHGRGLKAIARHRHQPPVRAHAGRAREVEPLRRAAAVGRVGDLLQQPAVWWEGRAQDGGRLRCCAEHRPHAGARA